MNNKVLFLELKRIKGSSTSPEQLAWIANLDGKVCFAKIAKGFDQAKKIVDLYIES